MVNPPRHFVYKMTTDNGGAPCVAGGLLTLAICKPLVRSSAEVGDWVYGIGGVPLSGRLIYIAQIDDKVINGGYYREEKYSNRDDCIYEYMNDRYCRRGNAKYHSGESNIETDLGKSDEGYPRANVLLSKNFRYLGDKGITLGGMKGEYPGIKALLDTLTQGHRVNHDPDLVEELEKLHKELWDEHRDVMQVGEPSHKDPSEVCSCDCGSEEISR